MIKLSPLSWRWTTSIIAIVLVLQFIVVTYVSDSTSRLVELEFLRQFLEELVLITFILAFYPFIWRLWNEALQALKPLLQLDDSAFAQLVVDISTWNRKREWIAVFVGVIFMLILNQPWTWSWESNNTWLSAYSLEVAILVWGLLGWLVYSTLLGIMRINRISRLKLNLDIFNAGMLTPISRWSLSISAVFIGGISLSLLFQTQEQLLTWNVITTYVILVTITLLIFFLSMRSIHSAMVEAKQQKLTLVRKHLTMATHEMENRAIDGQLEGISELSSTVAVAAWAAYEKSVQEASEWPFNTAIIRRLFASILIPASVYLLKILSALGIRISS